MGTQNGGKSPKLEEPDCQESIETPADFNILLGEIDALNGYRMGKDQFSAARWRGGWPG